MKPAFTTENDGALLVIACKVRVQRVLRIGPWYFQSLPLTAPSFTIGVHKTTSQ